MILVQDGYDTTGGGGGFGRYFVSCPRLKLPENRA